MTNKILKYIFFLLISIFGIFFIYKVDASSIPIEEVFSDINSDYEYYDELQYMFDNGVILPDEQGKFNPKQLLNRDEFVGIVMKVSCEECIAPNVSYDLINKYSDVKELFFDLEKNNKYFYCIASAKDSGYVKGYDVGTSCENGDSVEGQAPFCPQNTIILEEALAVVMRASGILDNYEADIIRSQIYSGEITQKLSEDVFPKNSDGSVYSFYPDFEQALDYQIVEYDNYGNMKTSTLINKSEYLRPKQAITKEKFLQIAYVAMKGNSCIDRIDSNIGLKMKIYEQKCDLDNIESCNLSSLDGNKKIYDFFADVSISGDDNISTKEQYIWRFYNFETGEEIKKYGKFLDNYDFLKSGKYRVYLRVISDNGNTGEVYNNINIGNNDEIDDDINNIKVSIDADPISGNSPLLVNFEAITSNNNIESYTWDFGDGNIGYGKNPQHIYKGEGVYNVTLTVKDDNGNITDASVLIKVGNINEDLYLCSISDIKSGLYGCDDGDLGVYSEDKENELYNNQNDNNIDNIKAEKNLVDTDNDGIYDIDDLCPLIPGLQKNKGCPILDDSCSIDGDCKEGYICDVGYCKPKDFSNTCEYSGGDLVYGNVACNSCPCFNTIDFNSSIRKCDLIFPAITSPDQSQIYSKGNDFEIK